MEGSERSEPTHPYVGMDARTRQRIQAMTRAEFAAYTAAVEAHVRARQHALHATLPISTVWATHPECATLGDLRHAMQGDPRTVTLIETAVSAWRVVADIESKLIAASWMDDDERSVIVSGPGSVTILPTAF